jgi:GNAT superfamily N-acetyltransferase
VSHAEREHRHDSETLNALCWPAFALEDPIGNRHWPDLWRNFPEYQIALFDGTSLVATLQAIPFAWDGSDGDFPWEGWAQVFARGVAGAQEGRSPTAASLLGITVDPRWRGRGLPELLIARVKAQALAEGLGRALVAPVRPTLKSSYPLTELVRYVGWRRRDGLPFDPWIRTHWRLGARPLAVCERSMVITGTVAQWERWTGLAFPESSPYIVPGALQPVIIDCERDRGIYEEPNYWMRHPL